MQDLTREFHTGHQLLQLGNPAAALGNDWRIQAENLDMGVLIGEFT